MTNVYVVGGSIKLYKKGRDLKIKGIENLDGMPDMTIYKTDKIESIEATDFVFAFPTEKTGFCKIKVQNIHQQELNSF